MANNIYSPGPQTIFNSSALGGGSWYRLHPQVRNVTFQALQVGSSVGVVVGSTIYIEVSNDGINALATKAGTIAFNGASPQSDGFTLDAHYEYVRANLNSATTGLVSIIASAQFGSQ